MLKSRPIPGVIPAKAGTSVQDRAAKLKTEIPAFAGMTRRVVGRAGRAGGDGV